MKRRWLKDWPWQTVVTINAGLCKEKNALHKSTSDGYDSAQKLWESSSKRELTLREVLDNTLYGTTQNGGSCGNGTLFSINTDGSNFTNLYNFTTLTNSTNSDGANPLGGVILSGDMLYGTAEYGGDGGYGVVFAVNVDGTDFTNLYSFNFYDGSYPHGQLLLSGNTLYGTTSTGGALNNSGIIFAVNTNGTGFTNLYNFTSGGLAIGTLGGLVLSGNTLYGASYQGGSDELGSVFAINTDGTDFTNLFGFPSTDPSPPFTNQFGEYWHGVCLNLTIATKTSYNIFNNKSRFKMADQRHSLRVANDNQSVLWKLE